ncbi:MAG TPA: glycosyl hydrolase [Solirubrobacteraceae bacterium]|nr:glycosyl hydrolase [Solirubrobacteraceae bacterium]
MRRTLVLLALLVGLLVMPAGATAKELTFGLHTPSDPFAGHTQEIDGLQNDIGRRVDVVSWFQNWGGGSWVSKVQPHVFRAVTASGRVPMVTWEPWKPGGGTSQPRYSLERIANGDFDDYITRWARDLRDLRSTVHLRPMHEMNGDWYPWGGTVNGNSPMLFKAAWARMHHIFDREGASNVKWVFSPVNEDWPRRPENRFEQYYPGDALVDVLALDGYNWGSAKPNFGGWRTFRATFGSAYRRLSRLGPQPIWIAEVGSATEGGSKAAWVRDMFRTAQSMRRLRAIIWMDTIDQHEGDWRVRSPSDVPAAFSAVDLRAARSSALRATSRMRAGKRLVLRWTAMGVADDVERWRIYLNGKLVRTLSAGRPRILRKRLFRPGRYRLRVKAIDVNDQVVASASARTRVLARRR